MPAISNEQWNSSSEQYENLQCCQQFSTAMTIIAKSYILSIWQHASWNRRCQWYLKVIKTEIKPAAICSEIQNLLWVAILGIVDAILASVQFWLNRKWRKVISLTPSYRNQPTRVYERLLHKKI